ncbi:MAG: hypothetical protein ACXVAY_20900 [Mucilaginibacter sp.]
MKITSTFKKPFHFALILAAISLTANAQKQPQIQEGSVRAPDNIKIDGKHSEWENPFFKNNEGFLRAYNSASRYYYTIANDDNYLYVALRGLGTGAAQKVFNGGLVILINRTAGKKPNLKATDNIAITYPLPQDSKTTDNILGPIFSLNGILPQTEANRSQVDSIVNVANSRLASVIKEIRITGVKEIQDSVLSVYNEQGIKAAMQFAKRMPMIEIAIPLKYLGLDINTSAKFSYDIILNGMTLPQGVGIDKDTDINSMYFISASDFWGEYTLAKKQ